MTVNALKKKYGDSDVGALSRDLVIKWKAVVTREDQEREQEEAEKLGSKKQAAEEASKSGGMFSRFLNSLGSSKDSSSSIQRPPPRVKDPEFFEMIDAKRKLAKSVLNPDKKYTELREQQILAPEYGQNFSEMLSHAAQRGRQPEEENQRDAEEPPV